MPVDIDEKTLEEIAQTTKARYFRATDTDSLREIYAEIDRAEKAPFEAPQFLDWRELYPWLAWPALLALLAEVTLGATWLRKLP
jgi:Ca-activated chloride channel family protein